MNNSIVTLQKIDGIYDIQPLIMPAHSLLEVIVLSVILFIFLATNIYVLWFYFFSIRAKSKRRIKELQIQHLEKEISSHDAIYQLCEILRSGFNLKHLSENTSLPNKMRTNEAQWNIFTKKITDLRYKSTSSADFNKIFEESLFWLKIWP